MPATNKTGRSNKRSSATGTLDLFRRSRGGVRDRPARDLPPRGDLICHCYPCQSSPADFLESTARPRGTQGGGRSAFRPCGAGENVTASIWNFPLRSLCSCSCSSVLGMHICCEKCPFLVLSASPNSASVPLTAYQLAEPLAVGEGEPVRYHNIVAATRVASPACLSNVR